MWYLELHRKVTTTRLNVYYTISDKCCKIRVSDTLYAFSHRISRRYILCRGHARSVLELSRKVRHA